MERTARKTISAIAAIAFALAFALAIAAPQAALANTVNGDAIEPAATTGQSIDETPALSDAIPADTAAADAAITTDDPAENQVADAADDATGETGTETGTETEIDATTAGNQAPAQTDVEEPAGTAAETDDSASAPADPAKDEASSSPAAPAQTAAASATAAAKPATAKPAASEATTAKPAASTAKPAATTATAAASTNPATATTKPAAASTTTKPAATAAAKPTATATKPATAKPAAQPKAATQATVKPAALTTQANSGASAKQATKQAAVKTQAAKAQAPAIQFRAHVQQVGWQPWASSGKMGTTGKSLRVEALKIQLLGDIAGSVQYQAYVQGIGWQNVSADGKISGTEGQSRRLEALRIALIGDISKTYEVQYRGHVQGIGWQKWTKNGAVAGTVGENRRLEALEIKLVKKAKKTADNEGIVGVHYNSHVQSIGWQPFTRDGATGGTSGRSLRVEATRIYLDKGKYAGDLSYRAHVQNIGWQKWDKEGSLAGTHHQSKRVEAFQIKLTGDISKYYDIAYRTHVQTVGWQPWTYNGGVAGTHGRSLRVEALQIKLIKKGTNQTVSEGVYYITTTGDVSSAIDDPDGKTATGLQAQIHTIDSSSLDQRYMVREEGKNLVSLQSVASGLYLADKGGKVVQLPDSKNAINRWKVSFDGGFVLTNASTGKVLSVNGGKVTNGAKIATAKKGTYDNTKRWTFASTRLIPNGYYEIQSRLGTYLDIEDGSYENGANVQTGNRSNGGSQRFQITATGSDYRIDNCKSYRTLDVSNASKSAGANVMQDSWQSRPSQKWSAEMNRAGYIVFTNVNSKHALSVAGSSKAAGANVQLVNKNANAANQNWRLVKSSRWSLTGDAQLDRDLASVLSEYTTLSSCFYYVADYSYISGSKFYGGSAYVSEEDTVQFAKEMLEDGGGNCYRFASLFMWLARGLGYDAETMSGWVVGYSGNQAPHGWTEVYYDGDTYVCDPDMQHEMPGYGWYWSTYSTSPTAYYFW